MLKRFITEQFVMHNEYIKQYVSTATYYKEKNLYTLRQVSPSMPISFICNTY